MLRLMTSALEESLRRRYSIVHVAARVAQVDEVLEGTREHQAALVAQASALRHALGERLWLPPDLASELQQGVDATCTTLENLITRLDASREGFASLPLNAEQAGEAPEPISLRA
jgi:MoxR-like ATPase